MLLEASGDPDQLKRALSDTDGVTAVSVRPVASRAGLYSIDCQVDAQEQVESRIARAVITCGELFRLERQQPTLENVFLRYIGHTNNEHSSGASA